MDSHQNMFVHKFVLARTFLTVGDNTVCTVKGLRSTSLKSRFVPIVSHDFRVRKMFAASALPLWSSRSCNVAVASARANVVRQHSHIEGAGRPRRHRLKMCFAATREHDDDRNFRVGEDFLAKARASAEDLRARLCTVADGKLRVISLITYTDTQLRPLAPEKRTSSTRVNGCTSVTFVEPHFGTTCGGETCVRYLEGYSDSRLASGAIVLLSLALCGKTLSEIERFRADTLLESFCLREIVMSPRMGGVKAILRHVQERMQVVCSGRHLAPQEPATLTQKSYSANLDVAGPVLGDESPAEVAVLLSGGVDSAVAMASLLERGFRVQPFYLKIWLEDELANLGRCPWEDDIRDAEKVCAALARKYNQRVQLETLSLHEEYWSRVVQYTIDEARRGRTPNPDIMCNSRIKFGAFLDSLGQRYALVASGHYARVVTMRHTDRGGETHAVAQLFCSPDIVKDQTYFLSQLSQQQLLKATFPIGDLTKSAVRRLARERYNLPNCDRPDSQGICFLGKLKFEQFLEHYLGTWAGPIMEAESGRFLGTHRGFWFYTIGQRKGLALPGGPWYVVGKDIENNIVLVSRERSQCNVTCRSFIVENVNWIGWEPSNTNEEPMRCRVKIRHGPRSVSAEVHCLEPKNQSWIIALDEPESGIAPGQFAVFYRENQCLGGGVIASVPALQVSRTIQRRSMTEECTI